MTNASYSTNKTVTTQLMPQNQTMASKVPCKLKRIILLPIQSKSADL